MATMDRSVIKRLQASVMCVTVYPVRSEIH